MAAPRMGATKVLFVSVSVVAAPTTESAVPLFIMLSRCVEEFPHRRSAADNVPVGVVPSLRHTIPAVPAVHTLDVGGDVPARKFGAAMGSVAVMVVPLSQIAAFPMMVTPVNFAKQFVVGLPLVVTVPTPAAATGEIVLHVPVIGAAALKMHDGVVVFPPLICSGAVQLPELSTNHTGAPAKAPEIVHDVPAVMVHETTEEPPEPPPEAVQTFDTQVTNMPAGVR